MLDLVIKNGKIIDGTGNSWFYGEIGVKDGKIVEIAAHIECCAKKVLDAKGQVVTPGFIDPHSHSDIPIIVDQRAQSKVQQGVTTELTGQCGSSAAPALGRAAKVTKDELNTYGVKGGLAWGGMEGYLDHLDKLRPAINQAILVGHGTVRNVVFGYEQREPSPDELEQMKILVKESIQAGAFGISTGLYYAPGSYSKTAEAIAVCQAAADLDGVHCTHIRDEADYNIGLIAAVQEIIDIAKATGVSTNFAHLKALGPRQWGLGKRLLEMIDSARNEGYDLTFDQYPYPASGSSITGALLPRWAQEGGREGTLAKLADKDTRKRVYEGIKENYDRRGGADRLMVAAYPPDRSLQGKTMKQIAEEMGVDPSEAAMRLLEKHEARFVSFVLSDEDVEAIMTHPAGMVGTDGSCLATDGPLSVTKLHPRNFGTYPKVLATYVRDKKVLKLEEAIRRMTSAPARKIGIKDRGLIRAGNWADIVVFDPDTVKDQATFVDPCQYPTGIKWVIVNGEVVVQEGVHQGVFPGHVLRKKC